ncbi:MAG TPA: hypothetical protein VMV33_17280 [Rhodocyclaceae bacterium]|nr:hypothetical protein [Rhodocyclaceae bacterium]
MTPVEFVSCLALLRWSASEVAIWCGYSRQTAQAWALGRHRIPGQVVKWLDQRLAGELVDPPARPEV